MNIPRRERLAPGPPLFYLYQACINFTGYLCWHWPHSWRLAARQPQGFVAQELAPRFPEGFTIAEGYGFWFSDETKRTISAIIENYQRAFEQEAVMRVDTQACVAF